MIVPTLISLAALCCAALLAGSNMPLLSLMTLAVLRSTQLASSSWLGWLCQSHIVDVWMALVFLVRARNFKRSDASVIRRMRSYFLSIDSLLDGLHVMGTLGTGMLFLSSLVTRRCSYLPWSELESCWSVVRTGPLTWAILACALVIQIKALVMN